jgi:ribosomal protein S18 acetylase RimI-like enzyme
MLIEIATLEDASEILSLQKLAYQSEAEIYDDFSIPPLTQTLEGIAEDFGEQVYLKAVVNGVIIGSVRGFLQEDTCYIGRLIVHPVYQNRGIGTRLLKAIETHFITAHRFVLFTGERSERNLYLYQKLGYRITQTRQLSNRVALVYLEKAVAIKNSRLPA